MEAVRKTLQGWKTYIVGSGAILTVLVTFADGGCDAGTVIQTIVTSLLAMTVRAGVQKAQDTAEEG